MKKLFKIAAILVVAVVVLVAAAAIAVPLLVDPQDVKDQLSARVKDATGRDLAIPGDVKLSVFPWLGATLGKVSLGNAKGFSAPVFASTEKVDVRVKLMPLLDRRLEMDTVTIHGLTLNLERDKAGKGNWEDLAAGGSSAKSSGDSSAGAQGQTLAGFAIGGIDVREGTVTFADAAAGQSYRLQDLSLATSALTPGKSVDMELGFDVELASPPMKGRVTAVAKVDGNPQTKMASISGLSITANITGDTLPGGKLDASLGADVTVDGNPETKMASISGLSITANMTGDTLPGGKLDVSLGADVTVDGVKNAATVRNLVLKVADLSATGSFDASGLDKTPAISGELAVAQFNPKALLEALGQAVPETTDEKVLTRLSLTSKLAGGADALTLEPLKVTLDDSTLSGKLAVSNFAAPAVRFALALDAIDVDRYLPPGSEAPPASPGAAAGAAGELPLKTLRGLNVAGTLKATKVKVAKLNVSDVTAKLDAKDGVIRLSPIAANLYKGTYAGNIALDARKKTPVLSLNEQLKGVQAGPLLTDLQGEAPISGTANVSAKLNAVGTAPDAIKRTLNGNIAFQFLNGAVNGVNIGQMIRDARAELSGGGSPGGDAPKKTDFAEITGTATVKNGLVSNQDLSAKSPLLRVTGKGTASLPKETVDYRATVTLVATSKGQGGKGLGDLSGVPIPLKVTGTFANPSYGLDTEGLARELAQSKAKDLLNEQKGKVTEKVEEQVKGKLGGSVDKILGGDKKGGGLLKGILGN